jgi:hypothetical protein
VSRFTEKRRLKGRETFFEIVGVHSQQQSARPTGGVGAMVEGGGHGIVHIN